MDDRQFFDEIYQLWSKTTGAEDRFWMPEEHFDRSGRFNVYAVGQYDDGDSNNPLRNRKLVASGLNEADADWLTALHGCFADLHRRLHSALDEADRADFDHDSRECRIMELECQLAEKVAIINGLSTNPPWQRHDVYET